MAETTKIGWTDHTSNVVIGCTKVGPGCDNCYAELLDRNRFSHTLPTLQITPAGQPNIRPRVIHWGPGAPRHARLQAWERDIRKFNRAAAAHGKRRRVFVNSLSDFWDNEWQQAWRNAALDVMVECDWLDFQILTKRPGNIRTMVPVEWMARGFPAHLHIGVTIVTKEEAKRDIVKIFDVPARVRFLSCEPLLEPINIYGALSTGHLSWVIVGGESGPGARPFDLAWARHLRDQCKATDVPFFMKQLGACPIEDLSSSVRMLWKGKDRAGADPDEWPADLRVQEFPRG